MKDKRLVYLLGVVMGVLVLSALFYEVKTVLWDKTTPSKLQVELDENLELENLKEQDAASYRGKKECLVIRSDVAEKLKIEEGSLNSWEDIEKLLKTIKEKYPEYTPVMSGDDGVVIDFMGNSSGENYVDPLGNMLGILELPVSSSEVTNYYESEEFKEICGYVYRWRILEYVASNNIMSTTDLVKEEYSLGFFTGYSDDTAEVVTKKCVRPMRAYQIFTQIEETASLAEGFTFDDTEVYTEIAACEGVIDEYKDALLCGELNPAVEINDFNRQLQLAGIDKVLTAKQRQLNHYLRNSK